MAAQPAGVELPRIAVDVVGAGITGAELEIRAAKLDAARGDKISQCGDALLRKAS